MPGAGGQGPRSWLAQISWSASVLVAAAPWLGTPQVPCVDWMSGGSLRDRRPGRVRVAEPAVARRVLAADLRGVAVGRVAEEPVVGERVVGDDVRPIVVVAARERAVGGSALAVSDWRRRAQIGEGHEHDAPRPIVDDPVSCHGVVAPARHDDPRADRAQCRAALAAARSGCCCRARSCCGRTCRTGLCSRGTGRAAARGRRRCSGCW